MPLNKTSLHTLAAMQCYWPSNQNTSVHHLPKQCLIDAYEEIVASRIAITDRDRQIAEAARIIEGMKTRSAKLQEERDNALSMLNPKPETLSVVPAGQQQRGVSGELPEA